MRGIEIFADTTIEDMVERYPQASSFFLRYGIRCFTCSGVLWGTVEEVLRDKGVSDIEGTLEELRRFVAAQPEDTSESKTRTYDPCPLPGSRERN